MIIKVLPKEMEQSAAIADGATVVITASTQMRTFAVIVSAQGTMNALRLSARQVGNHFTAVVRRAAGAWEVSDHFNVEWKRFLRPVQTSKTTSMKLHRNTLYNSSDYLIEEMVAGGRHFCDDIQEGKSRALAFVE